MVSRRKSINVAAGEFTLASAAKSLEVLPDAPPAPPGVAWLASEQVLLLSVDLPPLAPGQRRAAVGFAVEDRIAQPLEALRVVLGPAISGRYLVAVVARDVIAARRGGPQPVLLPDVLALPCPATGWAAWAGDDRVLVRLPDGTGFGASLGQLPLLWHHAGQPEVTLCGGELPAEITVAAKGLLPPFDRTLTRCNLAATSDEGRFLRLPRGALAVAAVLAVAAGLHLGLIRADLAGDRRHVIARETALRQALTGAGQPDSGDLDSDLATRLAAGEPPGQGGFLPLMAASSAALAEVPGLSLQGLTWSGGDLQLDLQAADLGGLQSAEAALTAAGIAVRVGSATSGDGAARVDMTLAGLK